MKRQDSEVGKVEPIATKVASPIAENTVDDGTQIELSARASSMARRAMPGTERATLFVWNAWACSGASMDLSITG